MRSDKAAALEALRRRSGLSRPQVARQIAMPVTSYIHYEKTYKKKALPLALCEGLAAVFAKKGIPQAEVLALAGLDRYEIDEAIRVQGLSQSDVVQYLAPPANGAVTGGSAALRDALWPGRANADLWQVKSRALELAGYLPGDFVVVDLDRAPAGGDVVCAQVYDWDTRTAQTILRLYEPPFLMPASQSALFRKPEIVDDDRVVIKGVVVASARQRAD